MNKGKYLIALISFIMAQKMLLIFLMILLQQHLRLGIKQLKEQEPNY